MRLACSHIFSLRAVSLVSGLVLGALLYAGASEAWEASTKMTHQEVMVFCRSVEKEPGPGGIELLWKLQRSEAFSYVRHNLPEYLDRKSKIDAPGSFYLSLMVWRAAILFGDQPQVVRAVENCLARSGRGVFPTIANDLVQERRQEMTIKMFRSGRLDTKAVNAFLLYYGGTPTAKSCTFDFIDSVVVPLMQAEGRPTVRLHAAYAILRTVEEDEIRKQAERVLFDEQFHKHSLLQEKLQKRLTPEENPRITAGGMPAAVARSWWTGAEGCYAAGLRSAAKLAS